MRPSAARWLKTQGYLPICEMYLWHTCDFVGARFGQRVGRAIPALEKVVAVELKLTDTSGVLRQCLKNAGMVSQSYAMMPCYQVSKMTRRSLDQFDASGIGLLSVGESVEMVIEARETGNRWWKNPRHLWRRANDFGDLTGRVGMEGFRYDAQ